MPLIRIAKDGDMMTISEGGRHIATVVFDQIGDRKARCCISAEQSIIVRFAKANGERANDAAQDGVPCARA